MHAFLERAFFDIFKTQKTRQISLRFQSAQPRYVKILSCALIRVLFSTVRQTFSNVVNGPYFNYSACVTSKCDKKPLRGPIVCRFAQCVHNFCHMSAKSSGDESLVAATALSEPPFGRHHPGDTTVVIVFRISCVTNKGRAGCFS